MDNPLGEVVRIIMQRRKEQMQGGVNLFDLKVGEPIEIEEEALIAGISVKVKIIVEDC